MILGISCPYSITFFFWYNDSHLSLNINSLGSINNTYLVFVLQEHADICIFIGTTSGRNIIQLWKRKTVRRNFITNEVLYEICSDFLYGLYTFNLWMCINRKLKLILCSAAYIDYTTTQLSQIMFSILSQIDSKQRYSN